MVLLWFIFLSRNSSSGFHLVCPIIITLTSQVIQLMWGICQIPTLTCGRQWCFRSSTISVNSEPVSSNPPKVWLFSFYSNAQSPSLWLTDLGVTQVHGHMSLWGRVSERLSCIHLASLTESFLCRLSHLHLIEGVLGLETDSSLEIDSGVVTLCWWFKLDFC